MSSWIVPIVVALIGGPLMILFARFDKRNTHQHGENMKILQRVESKVDKVDDRLSTHIDWHLDRDNK